MSRQVITDRARMVTRYKRKALLEAIAESTQALEIISDKELLTMDDYPDMIDEAEEKIQQADDELICRWYKEVME